MNEEVILFIIVIGGCLFFTGFMVGFALCKWAILKKLRELDYGNLKKYGEKHGEKIEWKNNYKCGS